MRKPTEPTGRPKDRLPRPGQPNSLRPPESEPEARSAYDHLLWMMRRDLNERARLQHDLNELDRESMPTVATNYLQQIDRLTRHIDKLDTALATIETGQRTKRLRAEEQKILASLRSLDERAERGEDPASLATLRKQYNWRLELVRTDLAALIESSESAE